MASEQALDGRLRNFSTVGRRSADDGWMSSGITSVSDTAILGTVGAGGVAIRAAAMADADPTTNGSCSYKNKK